jgi:ribosomal protein S19
MSRSIWKGPLFSKNSLIKYISNLRYSRWNKLVKDRSLTIPELLIEKHTFLHNGKNFKKMNIIKEKVGIKFGSCLNTRSFTRKVLKKNK